jgi:hypothetical protein
MCFDGLSDIVLRCLTDRPVKARYWLLLCTDYRFRNLAARQLSRLTRHQRFRACMGASVHPVPPARLLSCALCHLLRFSTSSTKPAWSLVRDNGSMMMEDVPGLNNKKTIKKEPHQLLHCSMVRRGPLSCYAAKPGHMSFLGTNSARQSWPQTRV